MVTTFSRAVSFVHKIMVPGTFVGTGHHGRHWMVPKTDAIECPDTALSYLYC